MNLVLIFAQTCRVVSRSLLQRVASSRGAVTEAQDAIPKPDTENKKTLNKAEAKCASCGVVDGIR